MLISCSKDFISDPSSEIEPTLPNIELQDQVAIIGEKIPNPYSIDIMKQAINNINAKTKSNVSDDIKPTHHYIQFMPASEEELQSLKINIDQFLYLYPLDYEVSDGWLEVDPRPEFSTNGYQHRWAYIPVNTDLSSVKCPYEILYDIFDPTCYETKSIPDFFADEIEAEAYRICGQELEPISETKAGKITPAGKILFYDSTINKDRGCEGLSVWANRGTHESYGHCNDEGFFVCNSSFKYRWTYHIYFSRTDFEIRKNDSTNELAYKYTKYNGPINIRFNKDSDESFYAAILRAAIMYYYGDIEGLRRPPMKNDWSARLAIQAHLKSSGSGTVGGFHENDRWILSSRPIVNIYRDMTYDNGTIVTLPHNTVSATTFHELTHAAHWRVNKDKYYDSDKIIRESLSCGMEVYLVNKSYKKYIDKNECNPYTRDYFRMSYTGIFEDLIDGYKTRTSKSYTTWTDGKLNDLIYVTKSYYDNVTGYTPVEVEEAMIKSNTWNEFEQNLLNSYPDKKDKNNVHKAFDYWNTGE